MTTHTYRDRTKSGERFSCRIRGVCRTTLNITGRVFSHWLEQQEVETAGSHLRHQQSGRQFATKQVSEVLLHGSSFQSDIRRSFFIKIFF